nr:hypothetical protein [Tanacetum cinerariifolium]
MKTTGKDTQVPQPSGPNKSITNEAVHKELGDSLVRAGTTASSLGAKQDSGKDTQVPQPSGPNKSIADEAVHKELGDSLVRAGTTTSSLGAEQDSGNITNTQSKATPNEPSSQGTDSGDGPRCQETIGDIIAQTRVESSGDEKSFGENASK